MQILGARTPFGGGQQRLPDVDLNDAAAEDFCAGLAGNALVRRPGGVFVARVAL